MELSEQIEWAEAKLLGASWAGNATHSKEVKGWHGILESLRDLRVIKEASGLPEYPTIYTDEQIIGSMSCVLTAEYDALRLHAQHLASKELK